MMRSRVVTSLALWALFVMVVGPAAAQGSGNRELHRIAIVPDPGSTAGELIVIGIWTVDVEPTSVPLDLSTEVTLCVGGVPIQTITVPVEVDPGSGLGCQAAPPCGGDCGTGTVDGESVTLICYEDCDPAAGCLCDCGVWIETAFDPLSITSGEEVKVALKALPGSVPDSDSGDDGQGPPYERPIGWAREPDPIIFDLVSEGVYDVQVPIELEWEGLAGRLNLDMAADLFVNGSLRRTTNVAALAEQAVDQGCFVSGCTSQCGTFNGAASSCDPLLWFDCGCGGGTLVAFPSVSVRPGDSVTVVLRPVPGALPELPGFDEDDAIDQICCGTVGVGAGGTPGPARLDQNRPNPFNPSTMITFALVEAGEARIEIFDANGKLVRTVLERNLGPGEWSVAWDGATARGKRATSGTYFYQLSTAGGSETRRMTLLE